MHAYYIEQCTKKCEKILIIKQRKQQADEYPSQSTIVDQKCQVQSTYFLTQDALGHWLNVHKTVCILYYVLLIDYILAAVIHHADSLPKVLVSKYMYVNAPDVHLE